MQLLLTALYILLYGAATSSFLQKCTKNRLTVPECLIYGFGIGPVLIPLELYLFYTLLRGTSPAICLTVITVLPLLLLLFSLREGRDLLKGLFRLGRTFYADHRRASIVTASIFIPAYLIGCLACIIIPLMNFDIVEYTTLGQHFADERRILYDGVVYFERTGFHFRSFHSFVFPLFSSFGQILSGITHGDFTITIKYVHYFYCLMLNLLFLLALFRLVPEKERQIDNIKFFFILNLTGFTVYSLTAFGIDFFRVFFLAGSFYLLYEYLKKPSYTLLFLLGIMASIAANAHILGAVIVPFVIFGTFFANAPFKQNFLRTLLLGTGVILLGYFHYFLMLFWGDGWVFSKPAIKIAAEDMVSRGFVTWFDYLFMGYLGQFFRLEFFGFFTIAALPAAYYFLRDRKAYTLQEKAFFAIYVLSCVLVAYFFYNFRYAYSLYPVTILFAYVILQKQRFAFFPKLLTYVLILNILFSCTGFYSTLYSAATAFFKNIASSLSMTYNSSTARYANYELRNKDYSSLSSGIKDTMPDAYHGIALVHNKILNQRHPDLHLTYYSHWEKCIYGPEILDCTTFKTSALEKYIRTNFDYAIVQRDYVPEKDMVYRTVLKYGKVVFSNQIYDIYQICQKGNEYAPEQNDRSSNTGL